EPIRSLHSRAPRNLHERESGGASSASGECEGAYREVGPCVTVRDCRPAEGREPAADDEPPRDSPPMLMSLAKRTLPSESIHALKRLRDSDRGLRAARQLQRLREAVQLRWLGLVRLSPRLSSAHYGLLSGAFGREHQGVVDGRWRYLKEKDE